VDRVRHETADGTHVRIAVRLQDDPEVGALATVDIDRPEELALMTLRHIYNFPWMKIIRRVKNPLYPVKGIAQRPQSS
jgi:hypothetical protein